MDSNDSGATTASPVDTRASSPPDTSSFINEVTLSMSDGTVIDTADKSTEISPSPPMYHSEITIPNVEHIDVEKARTPIPTPRYTGEQRLMIDDEPDSNGLVNPSFETESSRTSSFGHGRKIQTPTPTKEKNGDLNNSFDLGVKHPVKAESGKVTHEAVNLELVNMDPLRNGLPVKKETEVDIGDPYDEYFVPVNEHRKYMRGEKLYVTMDKRAKKKWRRYICWAIGLALLCAAIIIGVLAATGVILNNDDAPIETESSARGFDPEVKAAGAFGLGSEGGFTPTSPEPPLSTIPNIPPTTDMSKMIMVPDTLEGQLLIDNVQFSNDLADKNSTAFKTMAAALEAELTTAIFDYQTLNFGAHNISVKVLEFMPGSVIVTYRIGWQPKEGIVKAQAPVTEMSLLKRMRRKLNQNSGFILNYHISPNTLKANGVLDLCQVNKNECQHGCRYNYNETDFMCDCPNGQQIGSNGKTCQITEPSVSPEPVSTDVFANTQDFDHHDHVYEVETEPEPTSEPKLEPEPSIEPEPVSEPKSQPEPTAVPTSEPGPVTHEDVHSYVHEQVTAEPTPEPKPQPEPGTEYSERPAPVFPENRHSYVHEVIEAETTLAPKSESEHMTEPKSEPEPTTEHNSRPESYYTENKEYLGHEPIEFTTVLNSEPEPEPKSDAEPTAEPQSEPEPTSEPKSEPEPVSHENLHYQIYENIAAEPTPEPKSEPEPTSEPKSKPEPSSEPKSESEPTAEPKSEPEPTSEPKSESDLVSYKNKYQVHENIDIEPKTKPKTEPKSTGEPKSEPEPTSEPKSEPEPTSEPKLEHESKQEHENLNYAVYENIAAEPTREPKSEPEPTSVPEPTSEPKSEPEPTSVPRLKHTPTAEPKSEPEPTSEPKSEPEPTSVPNSEPEPTSEPKAESESTSDPQSKLVLTTEPSLKPVNNENMQQIHIATEITADPFSAPESATETEHEPTPEPNPSNVRVLDTTTDIKNQTAHSISTSSHDAFEHIQVIGEKTTKPFTESKVELAPTTETIVNSDSMLQNNSRASGRNYVRTSAGVTVQPSDESNETQEKATKLNIVEEPHVMDSTSPEPSSEQEINPEHEIITEHVTQQTHMPELDEAEASRKPELQPELNSESESRTENEIITERGFKNTNFLVVAKTTERSQSESVTKGSTESTPLLERKDALIEQDFSTESEPIVEQKTYENRVGTEGKPNYTTVHVNPFERVIISTHSPETSNTESTKLPPSSNEDILEPLPKPIITTTEKSSGIFVYHDHTIVPTTERATSPEPKVIMESIELARGNEGSKGLIPEQMLPADYSNPEQISEHSATPPGQNNVTQRDNKLDPQHDVISVVTENMSPFLPEVENNATLIHILHEGHDIDIANINDTDSSTEIKNRTATPHDINDTNESSTKPIISSEQLSVVPLKKSTVGEEDDDNIARLLNGGVEGRNFEPIESDADETTTNAEVYITQAAETTTEAEIETVQTILLEKDSRKIKSEDSTTQVSSEASSLTSQVPYVITTQKISDSEIAENINETTTATPSTNTAGLVTNNEELKVAAENTTAKVETIQENTEVIEGVNRTSTETSRITEQESESTTTSSEVHVTTSITTERSIPKSTTETANQPSTENTIDENENENSLSVIPLVKVSKQDKNEKEIQKKKYNKKLDKIGITAVTDESNLNNIEGSEEKTSDNYKTSEDEQESTALPTETTNNFSNDHFLGGKSFRKVETISGTTLNKDVSSEMTTTTEYNNNATEFKNTLTLNTSNVSASGNDSQENSDVKILGTFSKCTAGQFQCVNGTSIKDGSYCIGLNERCDAVAHCSDGSDELGCELGGCPGHFQCRSGSCLARQLVCDGIVHCNDGSDEKECEKWQCRFDELSCSDVGKGPCLPLPWQCDGLRQCEDGRDEIGCATNSSCDNNQFLCTEQNTCIPAAWRCDGEIDCLGGQDERICDCPLDHFRCKAGGCIEQIQRCDGNYQCPDLSDEWGCLALPTSRDYYNQNSNKTMEGPDELFHRNIIQILSTNETWLPVCSENWSRPASDLVCMELGFVRSHSTKTITDINYVTSFFSFKSEAVSSERKLLTQLKIVDTCGSGIVAITCEEFSCGSHSPNPGEGVSGRIAGAERASRAQWPSIALAFNARKGGARCTASIIAPRWALGSYSCLAGDEDVRDEDWKLFAGGAVFNSANNTSGAAEPDLEQVRDVKRIVPYPQAKYKQFLYAGDLVLLELDSPLSWGRSIGTACLATAPVEPRELCVTAGWGAHKPGETSIVQYLHYLPVPTLNASACNSSTHYAGRLPQGVICAGYTGNGHQRAPCYNDEGAPLMCFSELSGTWGLQGALSHHGNCGQSNHPAVFTSLSGAVAQWIANTVGNTLMFENRGEDNV